MVADLPPGNRRPLCARLTSGPIALATPPRPGPPPALRVRSRGNKQPLALPPRRNHNSRVIPRPHCDSLRHLAVRPRSVAVVLAALLAVSCKPAEPPLPPPGTAQPATNATTPPPLAPPPAAPAAGEPLPPVAIPAQATPEDLSQIYFDLRKTRRWEDLSLLYHEDAVIDFRERMRFLEEMDHPAAHQIRVMLFGADASKESIAALSDDVFFKKIIAPIMDRAATLRSLNFEKIDILGSVPEGDVTRHVVTRLWLGVGDQEVNSMELVTCKKQGDTWRILLDDKLIAMAANMKQSIDRAAATPQPAPPPN